MMWWGYGPGWSSWGGYWWLGPLTMLLFWALVIGGVVWGVRALAAGGARRSTDDPEAYGRALGILAERYARGEITVEEYRQMREELRRSG